MSVDGVSDTMFKKRTWEKLWKKHCYRYNEDKDDLESKKEYLEDLEDNLAYKL